METTEKLLDVIASYVRMIQRDNGEHPLSVLEDLEKSMLYVLEYTQVTIPF